MQINVVEVDERTGIMTGTNRPYAICGFIRAMVWCANGIEVADIVVIVVRILKVLWLTTLICLQCDCT